MNTHLQVDEDIIERRKIVSSLYRSILGREPDPVGLEGYVRRSIKKDYAGVVSLTTDGLLGSAEYRRRMDSERLHLGLTKEIRSKHKTILSFGTNCQVSSVLKRHGLKDFSAPFDWLLSSPGMIAHCITDRCATLLDKRHFEQIERRDQAQHKFYLENYGVDSVFAHINPLEPEHHDYLQRCVRRLFDTLSEAPVLVVMISRPHWNIQEHFTDLIEALAPWPNARLKAVQLAEPTLAREQAAVTLVETIDAHTLYLMRPSSQEMGVGWPDPNDDARFLEIIAAS